MLNTLLRSSRIFCPKINNIGCSLNRLQLFASLSLKDVLNETSDETGTLLTRFAKHIAMEKYKFDPMVPRTIKYSDYFPVNDMRVFKSELVKVPVDQLPNLITFISSYRSNADPFRFVNAFNDIDDFCVKRINEMDYDTLLSTLYSLLFLIPNKIASTEFYKAATFRLIQNFSESFPKEKFVHACFYLGLSKKYMPPKTKVLFSEFLETYLERFVEELSIMDLGVVTSAMYKTATAVQNEAYLKRLEASLVSMKMDNALMFTFLKNLRFHRVNSDVLCGRLESMYNVESLKDLDTIGLAHVFAYFAENKWDNQKHGQLFVDEFISRLSVNKKFGDPSQVSRPKDLCTFLWCCAQLDYDLPESTLRLLESIVMDMIYKDEFNSFPDQLVEVCQCLWMLGMKSQKIFEEVDRLKGTMYHYKRIQDRPKVDSRFTVLQSAVSIEYPEWTPKINNFTEQQPAPEFLLKARQDLTDYFESLQNEEGIAKASLVCPIKGINVPGIFVEFDSGISSVYVELLDANQTLKFSQKPTAILRLKIHLLTTSGYKVILLHPKYLEEEYTCLKDMIGAPEKVTVSESNLS